MKFGKQTFLVPKYRATYINTDDLTNETPLI